MRNVDLRHAKLAAFGSTRRKKIRPEEDASLKAMVALKAPVCTIFGKSWDLHVREALRTTPEENLAMIADSVRYLKKKGREVVYDAEHFFDGYKANPDYALQTLAAAAEAGADVLVLCDTNGGTMPFEVGEITAAVRKATTGPIGIHAHNDAGVAVANSLIAVNNGATHVQGTMNGYGERTGNADLIVIIPNLMLKLKRRCIPPTHLKRLTEFSRTISEIANQTPDPRQPYVGRCSFAHKAGIHVSAMERHKQTYEHVPPETVGNQRRVLISELSGASNIRYKAVERGIDVDAMGEDQRLLLEQVKKMEDEGYAFEAAEASFEVLAARLSGKYKRAFDLEGFRVIIEKRGHDENCITEATVKVNVGGRTYLMAAEGHGPINALDAAVRQALTREYPQLAEVSLLDYKVRVLNAREGTAAKVRVLIESGDGHKEWGTVGVSDNIIDASWRALIDSLDYKLMKK
jgi:2-isopropylmalate synthase